MQGSNIACVFMLCLDFRRLWKFTNGRTQHILILFRNSNVLLTQESVIYSQSHWVAVFPEHQCCVYWGDSPCELSLSPFVAGLHWPLGNFHHPRPCLSLHHHILTAGQSLPWESLNTAINWPAKSWPEEASVEGGVCYSLSSALMHMLFSLYKESVAYLEI